MLACALTLPLAAQAEELADLSLEQLMAVPVVGASKYEQTQDRVAAAVTVITRDEIRSFGWRTLDEALVTLPGVHTSYDRQYSYVGVRGFGLAGAFHTNDAAKEAGMIAVNIAALTMLTHAFLPAMVKYSTSVSSQLEQPTTSSSRFITARASK